MSSSDPASSLAPEPMPWGTAAFWGFVGGVASGFVVYVICRCASLSDDEGMGWGAGVGLFVAVVLALVLHFFAKTTPKPGSPDSECVACVNFWGYYGLDLSPSVVCQQYCASWTPSVSCGKCLWNGGPPWPGQTNFQQYYTICEGQGSCP